MINGAAKIEFDSRLTDTRTTRAQREGDVATLKYELKEIQYP
jgi:hypothetical protein